MFHTFSIFIVVVVVMAQIELEGISTPYVFFFPIVADEKGTYMGVNACRYLYPGETTHG